MLQILYMIVYNNLETVFHSLLMVNILEQIYINKNYYFDFVLDVNY